jgi:hypothetical protein
MKQSPLSLSQDSGEGAQVKNATTSSIGAATGTEIGGGDSF